MSQEIAVLPQKETAMEVYSSANGLDPYLALIRFEIDSFQPDVTTKKGRVTIASIAYKVAKSKTALDNMGKDLVAELKDVPKKIDAERKRARDILDAWKDEVLQPLTDFEAAEEQEAERLEAEARENNKAHAKRINNEAMQDFISAGIPEELAKAAVTAIAKGVIRNIAIKY